MGGPLTDDTSRAELPLAHEPGGGLATIRLENSLLEFSAETRYGPAGVDASSAARPGDRAVPLEKPRLSAREMCRLQTLPDDFTVPTRLRVAQRLLGNAVPAALAEFLGKEILRQFFDESVDRSLVLLPQRVFPREETDEPIPVPAKYLNKVAALCGASGNRLGLRHANGGRAPGVGGQRSGVVSAASENL